MIEKNIDGVDLTLNRKFKQGDTITICNLSCFTPTASSLHVTTNESDELAKALTIMYDRYHKFDRTVIVSSKEEAALILEDCFLTSTTISILGQNILIKTKNTSPADKELIRLTVRGADKRRIKSVAKYIVDEIGKKHTLNTAIKALYGAHEDISMDDATEAVNAAYGDVRARIKAFKSVEGSIKVKDISEVYEFAKSVGNGIILLKGPTGIGKNIYLQEPVALKAISDRKLVTSISHRRSIVSSSMNIDGMTHYEEITPFEEDSIVGLKVCVNSITSPWITPIINHTDVLLVDEAAQVLAHIIAGSVDESDRVNVFKKLNRLVERSDIAIFADADLNESVVNFAKSSGRQDVYIFEIEADHSDITVNVTDVDSVTPMILDAVEKDERVLIATDSKKKANGLYLEILKRVGNNKKVLVLHSDNIKEQEQAAFLADPNHSNYDAVIFSPVITSSMSITNDQLFTKHFGVFCGSILSTTECVQQLRRDRTALEYVVGIRNPYVRDFEADDKVAFMKKYEESDSFTKFGAEYLAERTFQQAHFAAAFVATLELDKFNVVIDIKDDEYKSTGRAQNNRMSRAAKEFDIANVLAAKAVDASVIQKNTMDGGESTYNNTYGIERARIEEFFKSDEVTRDDVLFWDKGMVKKQLANLKLAQSDSYFADMKDKEDKELPELRRQDVMGQYKLYSLIFTTVGINPMTGEGKYSQVEARNLLNKIFDHKALYRSILMKYGIKITKAWCDSNRPIGKINEILYKLFKLSSVDAGRYTVQGDRVRFYKIEPNSFAKMNRLIKPYT